MASLMLLMNIVFILVTQFVVKGSLAHMDWADRSTEIERLSHLLTQYYEKQGGSWEEIGNIQIRSQSYSTYPGASFMLFSKEHELLVGNGEAPDKAVTGLGIRKNVDISGETVAILYYYDTEVGNLSKIRIGISSSVTFLLMMNAILFILLSLLVTYWVSRRLTAPLRQLLPAIGRLRQGQYGTQTPVTTKDEYGEVAAAFNEMSNQLERAELVRKNLTADVAHELRTPLTIIRGKLDFLQQSGRSIEPESLLPIQDELIRLTRLVDDLHQLSLSEARRLPLEPKPVDITMLLQRIVDRVYSEAESKQIKIEQNMLTDRVIVAIDSNRMTQVFLNLLANAIRYTPIGGKVTLTVRDTQGDSKEPAQLVIKIADTGTGIEPEHLPFIFNRFYRTDQARTRNAGGMGLGLAIAREFVLAHHGTIEAESVAGQGTTMIIRLPLGDETSSEELPARS